MMHPLVESCRQWRYLLLLGALLALLVIQPIASTAGVMEWLFDVLLVAVMAVLVIALARVAVWRFVAFALCVPAAMLSLGGHCLNSTAREMSLTAGHVIGAAFFVVVAGRIVRSILLSRELSWDSIFGAICGYLLLGVAWGLTYAALYAADAGSFEFDDAIQPRMKQADYSRNVFMYYSFVTLTTVGYGDVTPLSISARTVSWVEAVTGQLYLAVLIAGLIGALVARNTATVYRE
jgi:hypothetical protein